MISRFLTSVKLTLVLLLGIAFISIFGTIQKVESNRYDVYFQTPWFRVLLLLLALNIAACTWKTLQRNIRDRRRFLEKLDEHTDQHSAESDLSSLERELKSQRFRIERHGGTLLASRGRLGRWGSTIVHVSLLIIMLGGILAELGFVGTKYVPVGHSVASYFDWGVEKELPLGFEFRVDNFELDHYPIELKIGVYDPQGRKLIEEYQTQEGERIELPLQGLSARVIQFDPFDKALTLDIYRDLQKIGSYLTWPEDNKKDVHNFLDPLLVLRPTAFRDPILRQTFSDVSILENGEVVKQQRIMVNHPLVYRGVAFFQTAYYQDEHGLWYVGFQISRDPGEWLVWVGSVLLILGVLCAFVVRYRVLAVLPCSSPVCLLPLVGLNDPYGQDLLERLSRFPKSGPESRSP